VFGTLFIAQIVAAVDASLEPVEPDGLVIVVEQPRLARALADRGRRVVMTAAKPRSLRRQVGARVYGVPTALPVRDAVADAVVVVGQEPGDAAETRVAEWARVVSDRGIVVLVDRTSPTEASRAALCGGLAEIRQRDGGRAVVTSGVVIKI
jgi:hypothetical protein